MRCYKLVVLGGSPWVPHFNITSIMGSKPMLTKWSQLSQLGYGGLGIVLSGWSLRTDIQKGLQGRVHQKYVRRCLPSALTIEEILIELNRNRIEYGSKMGYQTIHKNGSQSILGGCFLTHTSLRTKNAFHAMQIISRALNHEPCKDGWNREVHRVFWLYRPQHIKHFKNPQTNHEVLPKITCLKTAYQVLPNGVWKKAIP